jgi:hypothetical protein
MAVGRSSRLTDEELRREIYSLRRTLKEDIRAVREASKLDPTIPRDAINQYKKISKLMKEKSVRSMDTRDLKSTYRQLGYIRGLKSSTLEGAEKTAETFYPIKQFLDVLSPTLRDEFWDYYGKAYKENPFLEKFKYEIMEISKDIMISGRQLTPKLLTELLQIMVDKDSEAFGDLPITNEDLTSGSLAILLEKGFSSTVRQVGDVQGAEQAVNIRFSKKLQSFSKKFK